MGRTEKGVEREDKRQGLMVEKLKRGVLVGKRGGPCTPPPTWKLGFSSQQNGNNNNLVGEFLNFSSSSVSARKLCANLWEIQPHQQAPLAKMSKVAGTRLRRRRRHLHQRKDSNFELPKQLAEPPDNPSDQPASASSLGRRVAASQPSLVQHRRPVERNGFTLEPVSPTIYSSSMEVAPYNQAVTPTSSLEFKGRMGESGYRVRTSTELLKVLNRIWSLEEQHASNTSVVKALKMELDLSHARIKELLREKKMNRQEMEEFMKQIAEDKLVRRNKEQSRIKAAVQSVKEELEDERRLRKHSETLHRRLARELSEIKSSFSGSLRELERERKARILLENLCDEFAKGIRDYEQEVRSLNKGQVGGESLDRLILHISEAWLDERMQMKIAKAGNDLPESQRNSIVDKLSFDIETFLHAKRSVDLKNYGNSSPKELKEIYPCRHSLESFPLKEVQSAPRNMAGEDSIDTDFFEQQRATGEGLGKVSSRQQINNTAEIHREKKGSRNSMRKQEVQSKKITEDSQFQQKVGMNISCDDNESLFVERKSSEMRGENPGQLNDPETEVSTVCEATQGQGPQENDRFWRMSSSHSHRLDNLVGNSSLSSEGDKVHPEIICMEDSCVQSLVTGNGSPVKQWKAELTVPDFDKSQSCSKLPKGVKENTLMAKLLEARLEGQKSRSKACRSSFRSIREVSDEKTET